MTSPERVSTEDQLLDAQRKIIELEAATKTSLSGSQFLVLLMLGPVFLSFVSLGVLICYKTLSRPAEVAPHLDIVLVAFSIFSGPGTAAAATITSLMGDEIKAKIGGKNEG